MVVRTMRAVAEYSLKAPYQCLSMIAKDTVWQDMRVSVQFDVEGEGSKWFIGTVIAIKKDKFEVHFDLDGEKVWLGMDSVWQRDV